MNKVIKIEDYPCGSGKTTRMIEGFRPENKYLVIFPMLTEATRVIEGSKDMEFVRIANITSAVMDGSAFF